MGDDSRETDTSTTTPNTSKLPKGMILGKDGKPCRTCNSYTTFTSATKTIQSPSTTPSTTSSPSTTTFPCPPDVEILGHSTWTLLHTLTASYPLHPSPLDQTRITTFLSLFTKIYPCTACAEDFGKYMEREKVRTESREAFGRWMCEAHNEVNRKLGKGEFDCGRWEERWGVRGWREGGGRCG